MTATQAQPTTVLRRLLDAHHTGGASARREVVRQELATSAGTPALLADLRSILDDDAQVSGELARRQAAAVASLSDEQRARIAARRADRRLHPEPRLSR